MARPVENHAYGSADATLRPRACDAGRRLDRKDPWWARLAPLSPRPLSLRSPWGEVARVPAAGFRCGRWWGKLREFWHFPGQLMQLIYQLRIFGQGEHDFRIGFAQQAF